MNISHLLSNPKLIADITKTDILMVFYLYFRKRVMVFIRRSFIIRRIFKIK